MKTLISKFFIAIVALLILAGCTQDFLDEPKPTNGVPEEVVFSSRKGVEAFISGIMRRFRGQYTSTDTAGLNSLFYARSVKGNDLIQENTWFSFDYANDNREPVNRRTIFSWNYCFYMIGQANTLINGLEYSTLAEEDKKEFSAYGHALRGFFYHQLVMEFAPAYSADKTFAAPPIYTGLSFTGNPMSTVDEVYKFIVADLTIAIEGLTPNRLGKSYINKNVANAILAQVYQVMGNWEGAEKAANAAYGGDVTKVLDASAYRSGFDDYMNIEWIWGSAQSTDQSNYYWNAPASMADHLTTSYSAMYINKDFVNLFSETDVRGYFQKKSEAITNVDDYRYWITRKFKFSFEGDNAIIRTPEMILIEAEAKARLGADADAHKLLYTLQKNRDEMAVKSTNTGNALLEEILLERRKELYGEIGVEWFDAKRLRRGITRTGNHRILTPASLTADDKRFFLKIPQAEIDANPFIDDAVNKDR
ncbi:RagB/SusD family nutrient uptake outer membrane protein [Flavobacterium sp. GA093]|uniref:RagB/SusD family nutrient uptake outer membrane protein n=1 Tax=Flavobacterium hydrocarbonoxydans TaxID=2683249 RepID=A0A6I4NL00_9FLAO|nr:RagB/SusD family nutrient uptake outer membrane protein [Flavobacterium hydrocarbonoxydans]MWB95080.1 RagB/SusD family nutrient uptake outer membrane protein [Flavobacterium hydrocarbonoxydans]